LTASVLDPRVLTVAVVLAFGVALVFGLAPLRQALRIDCLAALKADRSVLGVRIPAARLRLWMAAVQVGLSVVLLIVASLLGRGLDHAFRVEPGYSTRNTFVVRPDLDVASGPDALGEQWRLVNGLRGQLAAAPGVVAVGLAAVPPFFGMGFGAMRPDGAGEFVQAHVNAVDPEYFVALGVTPIAGRLFNLGEASAAVVNVSLARRYFGDERAAVGRSIATPGSGSEPGTSMTVVGVIGPIQTLSVGLPDDPTYYLTLRDAAPMSPAPALVVRATDATPVAAIARDRLRQIDNGALVAVTSIEERLAARTGPARIGSAIAGVIGLLALVVAAVGIHGIVAHAVARRTRDIAICLALGASSAQVLRGVMGQTLRAVGLGALTGGGLAVVVAIAFSRPLKALLFGLAPLDPAAFLTATAVLLFVTLVAAYVPARRALGVQPADALRRET
jgi:ABC-type antimicrobial peptide transport system permease subunit